MSINKLSHLKEGEKIYLELERKKCRGDDADGLNFYSKTTGEMWMDDDDIFYTLNDMKQLANDGMLKHGDEIEVRTYSTEKEWEIKTVLHTVLITTDGKPYALDQWRYPPKKLDITLKDIADWKGVGKELINIINE